MTSAAGRISIKKIVIACVLVAGLAELGLFIYFAGDSGAPVNQAPDASQALQNKSSNSNLANVSPAATSSAKSADESVTNTTQQSTADEYNKEFETDRDRLTQLSNDQNLSKQRDDILALLADGEAIHSQARKRYLEETRIENSGDNSSLHQAVVLSTFSDQIEAFAGIDAARHYLDDLQSTSRAELAKDVADGLKDNDAKFYRDEQNLRHYEQFPEAIQTCGVATSPLQEALQRGYVLNRDSESLEANELDLTGALLQMLHARILISDVAWQLMCFEVWEKDGRSDQPGQP